MCSSGASLQFSILILIGLKNYSSVLGNMYKVATPIVAEKNQISLCVKPSLSAPSIYFTYHWFDWFRGLSLQLLVTITRPNPLSIILWWFLPWYSLTTPTEQLVCLSYLRLLDLRDFLTLIITTFLSCNKPIKKTLEILTREK